MKPGPIKAPGPAPEPPAEAARIRQLRKQAQQDRHLAAQINAKADALVKVRAGYIAGLLTSTGKAKTTAVSSAKRAAAAKKAAATRKKTVRKKAVKSSTTTVAATRASNVAKLNGQISTLRGDAKALAKSANHLDALANSL